MTTRALLLCAGMATRWENHDGIPKQLAVVRGEPVLHRAVRLLLERDPDMDVVVVCKDARDDRWKVDGARRASAKLDPSRKQADKLLSSEHLWNASGRTLALFGDVYFTDAAMDAIVGSTEPWAAFGRSGGSQFTGCDHRELFGFAFDADERSRMRDAADRCLRIHHAGQMGGWSGGWQIYAAATGAPDDQVGRRFVDRGNFVDIDDWTDDFDRPKDWDRWCWHWAKASTEKRAVGHR